MLSDMVQRSSACSVARAPASASIAVVRTRPSSVPAQYLQAAGPAPEQLVLGVGELDRRYFDGSSHPVAPFRPGCEPASWTASRL